MLAGHGHVMIFSALTFVEVFLLVFHKWWLAGHYAKTAKAAAQYCANLTQHADHCGLQIPGCKAFIWGQSATEQADSWASFLQSQSQNSLLCQEYPHLPAVNHL